MASEILFTSFSMATKLGGLVTKPIVKIGQGIGQSIGDILSLNYEDDIEGEDDIIRPLEDFRMSIEGTLWCRKGRTTKWKRRLVVLRFEQEGVFECYKVSDDGPPQILKDVYSQLHRQTSVGSTIRNTGFQKLLLHLDRDTPWIARDVETDPSTFVIEVPTDKAEVIHNLILDGVQDDIFGSLKMESFTDPDEIDERDMLYDHSIDSKCYSPNFSDRPNMTLTSRAKLERDFKSAQKKNLPLRLYFKCPRSGNEKALWLRGFSKVDRLGEPLDKRNFFGKVAKIGMATSRIRRDVFAEFTREARQLEMGMFSPLYKPMKKAPLPKIQEQVERREFLVYPTYCYPHVWMTQSELLEECNLPSSTIHDLRIDSMKDKEIGTLSVEVLQCFGLPKLDRNSESDAVCYLVCGSYAFATDVIPSNAHPIWPRKSRRACIFPVFHGYARLFVGVFDDDSKLKDDFAGRIVIHLSRLRPNSTYDVTIPLRTSAHVYSRRPRGSIRLRFQLEWKSERAAILSYLPTSLKIPKAIKPNTSTTVTCADPKAFRNIAITVHGVHLPGKFSYKHFRATMKEVTFSRKMMMLTLRTTFQETRMWVHPSISLFVFCAWMHCIWINSFGLVPAYTMCFLLLHLVRNYVLYGIDGPASRGFVPPTWEEMLLAVFTDRKRSIRPLSMLPDDPHEPIRNPLLIDDEDHRPIANHIDTHIPLGKTLFRLFGFLESEEVLSQMSPYEHHLEFPMSNGVIYPPLSVRDSMAKRPRTVRDQEDVKNNKQNNKTKPQASPSKERSDSDSFGAELESEEEDILMSMEVSESTLRIDDNNVDFDQLPPTNGSALDISSPDQDIDYVYDNGGKKVTEDLEDMKENMHKFTWHLFNYKTHEIKNPDALFFGQSKKPAKRKDTKREIEKLLELGSFSSSNMIISRAAPYITPLLGAALSFLGVFRSSFNIFTWRDPVMSFWVSVFGFLVTVILFVFPWRFFLFITGVLVIGPQNWLYYQVYMKRKVHNLTAEKTIEKEKSVEAEYVVTEDQPIITSHPLPNTMYAEIPRDQIDLREVHHVIIPYAPIASAINRFYDWPPEPEFSNVTANFPAASSRRIQSASKQNRLRSNSRDSMSAFGSEHQPFRSRAPSFDTMEMSESKIKQN